MRGRIGYGAALGLWAGLALIGWVVLWPRRDGDFYEVGDPLVYLGSFFLLFGVVAGALLGAASGAAATRAGGTAALSSPQRRVATVVGVLALAVVVALYAWGVG